MMMPEQCRPNACGPGFGHGPAAMGCGDVAGRHADPGPPMGGAPGCGDMPPGGFDHGGGACGPAECGPGRPGGPGGPSAGGPGGPPAGGGMNQIVIQIFYGDEPPEGPPPDSREDAGGRYCGWRNWRNWRNA